MQSLRDDCFATRVRMSEKYNCGAFPWSSPANPHYWPSRYIQSPLTASRKQWSSFRLTDNMCVREVAYPQRVAWGGRYRPHGVAPAGSRLSLLLITGSLDPVTVIAWGFCAYMEGARKAGQRCLARHLHDITAALMNVQPTCALL